MGTRTVWPRIRRGRLGFVGAMVALVILAFGATGAAQAASPITITVTSTADVLSNDGKCTLREAIIAENSKKPSGNLTGECPAGTGLGDTLVVPAGTYVLARTDNGKEDASQTGDLDVKVNLNIKGAGADVTIIDGSKITDRVLQVLSGTVTVTGVTLRTGNVSSSGGIVGGGLWNGTTLTVTNSAITGSTAAGGGGGVYNASSGLLKVNGSTISGNTSGDKGGGLFNDGGSATLWNTTISGNSAKDSGGGIYTAGGTVALNNVTIANNTADSDASGAGDGGGVAVVTGTVTVANSIIGTNLDLSPATKVLDCSGTIKSGGYNVIQSVAGCTVTNTLTGNQTGVNPGLGPLQNNGGTTFTQALLFSSPAIDAGNPATPTTGGSSNTCFTTDQRGKTRPQGAFCDPGAFELENPPQRGPVFTVYTTSDTDRGYCGFMDCSLREAIKAANARPNGATPDQIVFKIAGTAAPTIAPAAPLPPITDTVTMDATTQGTGGVILAGSGIAQGTTADGLTITTNGVTVQGLTVQKFSGNGISISGNNNIVQKDTLTGNSLAGVAVLTGTGNTITSNSISGNSQLGIDLGPTGVTPNHIGPATGANNLQNFPFLVRASTPANATQTSLVGRLNSTPNTAFKVQIFSNAACDASGNGQGETFLTEVPVTTDANGDVVFQATVQPVLPAGRFLSATATDAGGNTSEFSPCLTSGAGNDTWPTAFQLTPAGSPTVATADDYLDAPGQSRWYKFHVPPNAQIVVALTNLPVTYDLTLYKDIAAAYQTVATNQDLVRLNAEVAGDVYAPSAFSPSAFSPSAFSPSAFSPSAFSPSAFSPSAFSPSAFSPSAFSPSAFSPSAFSPSAFSPSAFSPDAYTPDALNLTSYSSTAFSTTDFTGQPYNPTLFNPAAFTSAQTRSLVGVSAYDGTAGQGLVLNSWNTPGDYYVRVRGRNGAFSLAKAYHLLVQLIPSACSAIAPVSTSSTTVVQTGNYKTIILTDSSRIPITQTLSSKLTAFMARSEVQGVLVDVSTSGPNATPDARVAASNAQADANPSCPYAKNLVAADIKSIVDRYRQANPSLQYIVLVGSDNVIPFFRYPDEALLGDETDYVPPVFDQTSSQASLRNGYVLSQDAYGANGSVSIKSAAIPLIDLPVGRLVETPDEIGGMLDAYIATSGALPAPKSALVTGYDFLASAATAVAGEFSAGGVQSVDQLIAPRNLSPQDPAAWTANDLRNKLLGNRHDLIFLAGHFSQGDTLAADYATHMFSTELLNSPVDLTNALVFSAGCHSGYNTVDAHAITGITAQPDWAQTFARKKVTFIGGTGYQYGDTDFIEYSARLYLLFSQQLRTGTGPVPVGEALFAAKRAYLASTPVLRGIHEKALLEATLFGLPMISVNMSGARLQPPTPGSSISPVKFGTNPGDALNLQAADIAVQPQLQTINVDMTNTETGGIVPTSYVSGANGVVTNPSEPVLPVQVVDVSVAGTVLRGVGFRGGSYQDTTGVTPVVGAPTTELRGIHAAFPTDALWPVQPWSVNYMDALASANGATRLMVTPAQFIGNADPAASDGTRRVFSAMNFRLYYSNNVSTIGGFQPGVSSSPTLAGIKATSGNGQVTFRVNVTGNPAAGIQEAWVVYTVCPASQATCNGTWTPLDLAQSPTDSTLWTGSLNLGTIQASDIRYIVQAANGVGMVTLNNNLGQFFIPDVDAGVAQTTSMTLSVQTPSGAATSTGAYGTQVNLSGTLKDQNGSPLAGRRVTFAIGSQSRGAVTDSSGNASATLLILQLPGQTEARAIFGGSPGYLPSAAPPQSFKVVKGTSQLSLTPTAATSVLGADPGITATLSDTAGRRLVEKSVVFVVSGSNGSTSRSVITDYLGRAGLGMVNLPRGHYNVNVYFSGNITIQNGTSSTTLTLNDDDYNPSTVAGTLDIVDRPPVSQPDTYTTLEDMALAVSAPGVLANDSDPDADPLTAVLVSGAAHGTVALKPDGSFVYTPAKDYNGVDTFTYQASDSFTTGNTVTVTLTITPVNDPPSFTKGPDQVVQLNAGPQTVTGWATNISAGPPDESGQALTFTITTTNHSLFAALPALSASGTLTFATAPNAVGSAIVGVTLHDNGGTANGGRDTSATQTFKISVNRPPDCSQAAASTPFIWQPNGLLLPEQIVGVTDPDNNPVTITINGIRQDEPVPTQIDGQILGPNNFTVRSERDGGGDGRVYHIYFTATDGLGGSCSMAPTGPNKMGGVLVAVPHDQSTNVASYDQGGLYNSLVVGGLP